MAKVKDLTGQKFGRWTVISRAQNGRNGKARWICQCECGTVRDVYGTTLRTGASKCCGCTRKGNAILATKRANTKHGHRKSRLYTIWRSMKGRIHCQTTKSYERYGGRGIKICKEWEDNFTNFMNWALKNGYKDTLTLDRINPDGNYCPENCRWATWSEQAKNKSNRMEVKNSGTSDSEDEKRNHQGGGRQALP